MEQHHADGRPPVPGRAPAIGGAERERVDRTVGDVDLTRWRTRAGRTIADSWAALGRRFGALPLLLITLLIGIGIAAVATWVASEVYDAVRESDDVAVLDRPVLDWMIAHRTPALDQGVTWWTDIAGTIGMPIVAVLFLVVAVVPVRAHPQRDRRRRHDRVPAAPPTEPCGDPGLDDRRRDAVRAVGRGLAGVPRAPLDHRRAGGVGARAGLARARRHGAPAVPDGAAPGRGADPLVTRLRALVRSAR